MRARVLTHTWRGSQIGTRIDLIAKDTVNVEVPLGNFQCLLIGPVLPRDTQGFAAIYAKSRDSFPVDTSSCHTMSRQTWIRMEMILLSDVDRARVGAESARNFPERRSFVGETNGHLDPAFRDEERM